MYFQDKHAVQNYLNEAALDYVDPVTQENLDYPINEEAVDGEGIIDHEALLETYLVDLIGQMSDEQRKVYYESEEFQNLLEAGVAGRRAVVRMSKESDLQRRINLASIQMAKEKGDADWDALRRNRVNERRLLDRIYQKYSNAVRRDAQKAQKQLIKLTPNAFSMTKAIR